MVAAQRCVAKVTLLHTDLAPFLATLRTVDGIGGKLPTAGTFIKTIKAEGFAAAVALVEAGADLPPTFATGDEAVGTETLA
jgi:hypothetical protein